MASAEDQLKILAAKANLEWRDGAAHFNMQAHHMSEVRAVQSGARALAEGRVTQRTLDWMDALVTKHMREGYHAFARDTSGMLRNTGDDMHRGRVSDGWSEGQRAPDWVLKLASIKPEPIVPMPEEVRGLYLMTYSVKQQLRDASTALAPSQRIVEKHGSGEMCIDPGTAGVCRYGVEAVQQPSTPPRQNQRAPDRER